MKKLNIIDIIDGSFITAGVSIALQDIQSILSIIILVLEGLWLLVKLIMKARKYLQDGKIDENEKQDLEEDFNQLKNVLKEGEKIGSGRKD